MEAWEVVVKHVLSTICVYMKMIFKIGLSLLHAQDAVKNSMTSPAMATWNNNEQTQ